MNNRKSASAPPRIIPVDGVTQRRSNSFSKTHSGPKKENAAQRWVPGAPSRCMRDCGLGDEKVRCLPYSTRRGARSRHLSHSPPAGPAQGQPRTNRRCSSFNSEFHIESNTNQKGLALSSFREFNPKFRIPSFFQRSKPLKYVSLKRACVSLR